jgi:hypothetical protein
MANPKHIELFSFEEEIESPAVRMEGIYYGAFYQDNDSVTNYVFAQRLISPLVCLGDGHDGVWNLFSEIAALEARCEILDWYHLKENLYKLGGSLKRLAEAESFLWHGQRPAAQALFADCRRQQARHFAVRLVRGQWSQRSNR